MSSSASTDEFENEKSGWVDPVDIHLDKDISTTDLQQSSFLNQSPCEVCEQVEKLIEMHFSNRECIDKLVGKSGFFDNQKDAHEPEKDTGEHEDLEICEFSLQELEDLLIKKIENIKKEESLISIEKEESLISIFEEPLQSNEKHTIHKEAKEYIVKESLETKKLPVEEREVTKPKLVKKKQQGEECTESKNEVIEPESSAHFLEVNHTITESHQLLHVKTIVGVLQSIIGVIHFTMKGSIVFDLNDVEIWTGFANRCEELKSQLGILTESFLEKKIAEKMRKKKKRQDRLFGLIKSLGEKPTRSKLRRLPKAMKNMMECERQVGLIQGEIIFIRDITLISESLRDLFLFMEAELLRKGPGLKYRRTIKGGKTEGRRTRRREKRKQVAGGATMGSTEKKEPREGKSTEKPQEGKSTEKPQEGKSTEKPQEGKSTEKPQEGKSTEKPQEGKSTEKSENKASGQKGASKQSADTKDPMVEAVQGKVGELGEQLGGQVKHMGDRVIKGLFQKAKDMTNLM